MSPNTLFLPEVNYLQSTVHHADDVVKLLVVQYGSVLLDVETELLSQTLASCFAFQGSKSRRKSL